MKLMFISDIHGSEYYLNEVMNTVDKENPDYICLLGDLLYHGPRNPLPKGYNPKAVIEILNGIKSKIIAVGGNCDSAVDQMVLSFPMLAPYTIVLWENRRIFMTHGHIYNEENLPALNKGDCVIQGHSHIPMAKSIQGIHLLNPGSISLPKEDTPHCYGIIEEDTFVVKTLAGEVYFDYAL